MWIRILLVTSLASISGCTGWSKTPASERPLIGTGQFAPPAEPTPRLRVAVPDAAANNPKGAAPDLDLMAATSDELFALLDSSSRFELTERQRLRQMLAEQKQTDMLQPGRLVHPAPVHGFDYLMLAQINDLSITKEPPPEKVSVEGFEQMVGMGKYRPNLIVSAKVDLSLVDARTGIVAATGKTEFHHVGSPQSMGLQVSSEQLAQAQSAQLNPSDTRKVLRIILDDALRPLLPRIDRFAASLPPSSEGTARLPGGPATAPSAASGQGPTTRPQAAPAGFVICPECGAKVSADQEFCPNCGHKLK